jgi:4-hydroxyphenylpyruvate dioxygenase
MKQTLTQPESNPQGVNVQRGKHFADFSRDVIPAHPGQEPSPTTSIIIDGFDYIELYTESVRQSVFFLSRAFGFRPFAYRGPETGWRESVSVAMKQGEVVIQLTSPLIPGSSIAQHLCRHGFSVKDVAFRVSNAESCHDHAVRRGAVEVVPPTKWSDPQGHIVHSAIATYGDTVHSFVDRSMYAGLHWPGFVSYDHIFPNELDISEVGIKRIDHIVGNVELGAMNQWIQFYENVLGFQQLTHFTDKEITTEYSALMSKIMNGGDGKIKLPINEPAEGKRKSQIQEFLDFNGGPGVQHLAFETDDILATVRALRDRSVRFLSVPKSYYADIPARVGDISENLESIAMLGILVDRDEEGYLLQIFTKNLQDRPTLFLEIIQRAGSRGFGVGNFKALFEAIEREQAERGNL